MHTPLSLKDVIANVSTKKELARLLLRMIKLPILYVEGATDQAFFKMILGDSAYILAMEGKNNVLGIIRETEKICKGCNFTQRALAVVDLDADYILDNVQKESPWVLYIDIYDQSGPSRDLEVMLFRSHALYKLLCRFELEDSHKTIRDKLLNQCSVIGAARVFLNGLPVHLSSSVQDWDDLTFRQFYDFNTLDIDIEKFLRHAFGNEVLNYYPLDEVIRQVRDIQTKFPATELSRGHDLLKMLSAYLFKDYSEIKLRSTESQLLVAYEESYFNSSGVGQRVRSFIANRPKSNYRLTT